MKALYALILTLLIWTVTAISSASSTWVLTGVYVSLALRYYSVKSKQQFPSRDPLLLVALIPSISLTLYALMFSVIEVNQYIDSDEQGRHDALFVGGNFVYALLSGGAIHLMARKKRMRVNYVDTIHMYSFRYIILAAWIPLGISMACYLLFFSGRDYVEIHSSHSFVAGMLLKSIYFSYAAAFLIVTNYKISESSRVRNILMLLAGHVVVFGLIYKLRSPAIFFALLSFFLVGRYMPRKVIIMVLGFAPFLLSAVAIARDPSLMVDKTFSLAVFAQIITFGEFVDALRFSIDYVASSGPMWGSGMIGSLLGISEPLANVYAKSISKDYFDSGGGFGFFILGDIYANFGFIFGIVFLIFLGYQLSKLATSRFGSTASFISCVIFASAVALTRNDFGSTLRGVFYCLLTLLILKLMTGYRKS
ncbi:hypothetical protein [Ferrovum sp.]|uniref:hypothetical protein n=1 Tax=Ferrovum sp. TaxID=2609467 RepID=UPI002623EF3F|nr:hypothetical protein [Ferrovum sp.]